MVRPEGSGPGGDPVLLVAHGSRDPRAADATRALARAVSAARPGTRVLASWLDHTEPGPTEALRGLAAAGHPRAVLVPLLLTAAYHRRVDIPAAVAAARDSGPAMAVRVTDVLGPADAGVDPALLAGLRRRLAEAEPGRFDAVVLAAAGTRDAGARGSVGRVAEALGVALHTPTRIAYASAAPPGVGAAVARLRARGARRVAVAAYFLAPGLFHDAVAAAARDAGAVAVAAPLTDAPELVDLVLRRVDADARAAGGQQNAPAG
ncbi:CbiX/SirB N-terminal domain-containing protein [Micromonospora sp. WMMD1082]|uniref:sirohydrochlorin chelatase n=1 Tax=Micromonospora sp. WMMD1082 TaxID=3016104 RepID=UPI002417AA1D|nr:CbiX/SirB N-terminal domain-containing protein [Micromonospora sp. WMMD1082]MDG4793784.1 CbiX/SirB N-terminal domain-containing protein [Micromonospora sp. WMMD1082]